MSLHSGIASIAASICLLSGCGSGDDDSPVNEPPVNGPPVIGSQSLTGIEDVVLEGQVFTTAPGDSLKFVLASNPSHGTLENFGLSGSFRYRPDVNFYGADSFSVSVVGSRGIVATTTLQLTIAPVNDTPIAADDVFTGTDPSGLAVLANDRDAENEALTIELVGAPFVGTASVTNDNRIAMQVPAGFKGLTKFSYRVSDPTGQSSEASALVFIGIDPLKVVYLGGEGIFANDLLTTQRVSPPVASPTARIQSMQVAASGRALAYLLVEGDPQQFDTQQLMYVDLDHPGVARAIASSVIRSRQWIKNYHITADGRYVIYEFVEYGPPVSSTMLFDAQGNGDPVMLGGLVAGFGARQTNTGTYSKLNAAGTRVYHASPVPGDSREAYAVYRSDFSTRVMTRVSPVSRDYDAFGGLSVADNETKLTTILRRRAVGSFDYSDAYFVDPNGPDSQVKLSPTVSTGSVSEPLILSPDGRHVFLSMFSQMSIGIVTMRIVQTTSPVVSLTIGTEDSGPGDHRQNAEVNGLDAGYMMRRDSRAMLLAAKLNLYEVLFDDTLNPILINAAAVGERLTDGRYSPDGERIFHVRRTIAGTSGILEMTRRAEFGTSIPLTSSTDHMTSYTLDAQGRIAVFTRDDVESPIALVNSDVPQVFLPVSGPGATATSAVAVVPR